jgi:uncharacterized protein
MNDDPAPAQSDLPLPVPPGPEPPLEPPETPPPRPLLARIFLGHNGIRAGWRLLIFVALLFASALLLLFLAGPFVERFRTYATLVGEAVGFAAAVLASLVMGRIEKRSFTDYGLPPQGAFGREFWIGVAWGFLALTSLLVIIHLGHGFDFGRIILSGKTLASYAALWGVTFLMVGFSEEYIFRGYALATLSTGIGFWPSAVLLSALFGGVHIRNAGEDWAGALCAALIGLFLCLTLRRTGSLWFAIGMHASWDYGESFIYSVPDSGIVIPGHLMSSSFHGPAWITGGTVGPEGSALVFVVIGALFLIFSLTHRDVRFRPEEMKPRLKWQGGGLNTLIAP